MLGGETMRLPVGGFRLKQPTLPLVETSLFEPSVDGGPVALSACGFLTASLGSIHDASAAAQSVAEKRRAGQRPNEVARLPGRANLQLEQR